MEEDEAALKIQRCWRQKCVRDMIVLQARDEFTQLCEEFQDQMPIWESSVLTKPKFAAPPPEIEHLWLEHAIAQRLSVLKYQDALAGSRRG
jgi:hypothetical protein